LLALALVSTLSITSAESAKSAQVREDSFKLLNEGVAAVNRGEYALAVEKLQQASATSLNSFRAHFYLGLALTAERRYVDAAEALKVALDLDPNHLQAHVALGDSYLKQGDLGEASAEYNRALKLRAEYPPALDGIARTYEAQADDERAINFYNRAIASNKGYAEAYTHLGDLYLRVGRLEEAVRLLAEAITIRPDFGPGLNRLALAYNRLGLQNEAVATIRRAIAIEPASAEHRATLGLIQLDLGLMGGAEVSFGEAMKLDRALPSAHEGMAEIHRRRGDYAGAIQELDPILQDPRTDTATRTRVEERKAKMAVERDDLARLEAAIAGGSATEGDKRALAAIYAGRRMWVRAADLQMESGPEGAERERLAYYEFRAGRYRASHEIYRDLARNGGRADLEVNAGVALAQLGENDGAAAAFERALTIDPAQERATLYLGNALLRLGKKDEAVRSYRAFLEGSRGGELAERVRRILSEIAPESVPVKPVPATPPPAPNPPEKEQAS
jgi:tetratricopeptide (TPR) repeat protein